MWRVLVTAQQLQHMSAWEAIGEASLLRLPPPHLKKTTLHWLPSAVAMALGCSGNWRTRSYSRETVGFVSPKLGKEGHNYLLL